MRFDLMQAIGEQDLNNLVEIKRNLAEIEGMKNELTAQSIRQRVLVKSLKIKQREMEKELAKQKSLFSRTQAQLIRLQKESTQTSKICSRCPFTKISYRGVSFSRGGTPCLL